MKYLKILIAPIAILGLDRVYAAIFKEILGSPFESGALLATGVTTILIICASLEEA